MRAVKRFPLGIGHRIFENVWVWDKRQESNGEHYYVLSFAPAADEHEGSQTTPEAGLRARSKTMFAGSFVKGTTRGAWKVKPVAPYICELTLVQTASYGGTIPTWVSNSKAVTGLLSLKKIQQRFRRPDKAVDKVRRDHQPALTLLFALRN